MVSVQPSVTITAKFHHRILMLIIPNMNWLTSNNLKSVPDQLHL